MRALKKAKRILRNSRIFSFVMMTNMESTLQYLLTITISRRRQRARKRNGPFVLMERDYIITEIKMGIGKSRS